MTLLALEHSIPDVGGRERAELTLRAAHLGHIEVKAEDAHQREVTVVLNLDLTLSARDGLTDLIESHLDLKRAACRGLLPPWKLDLWEAIHRWAFAAGLDAKRASRPNTDMELAVVAVERAVERAIRETAVSSPPLCQTPQF
jgi:hypothetical protein